MEINYATTNEGKKEGLENTLNKLNLDEIEVIQRPLELPEPQGSLEEIAKFKVESAYKEIRKPTLALDGGFYMEALDGFPGPYTKFALETIGIRGILKLIKGKNRKAEFRNCLAYLDSERESPKLFFSKVKGTLANEPRGELHKYCWSRIPLIFIPKDHSKTLAEMGESGVENWHKKREENSTSYKFGKWLRKELI